MKAIVAHSRFTFGSRTLDTAQKERVAATARKTLGTLVGELLGTYLVVDEVAAEAGAETDAPEGEMWIEARFSFSPPAEDLVRIEAGLRELVVLRNDLVHHFLDQHDVWSPDGCRAAQEALVAAYDRIFLHHQELQTWGRILNEARRQHAEILGSDESREFIVYGIAPDGTVHWQLAGIVRALKEAASELTVEGWTSVEAAGQWIAERYPEVLPAKYGCRSWRQVIHESGLFDLCYMDRGGQRAAWYRLKQVSGKAGNLPATS
ncbi:MAG: hypothetical protein H6915_08670 [Novosphingobium sp.]|nr:hypothetical protein [Novosphingobium sp.]